MPRRFLGVMFAAATWVSQTGAAPAQTTQLEKKAVTISVAAPPTQAFFLPIVLTKALGNFEKEGLSVELIHFGAGSKALEALVGGSADLTAGAYEHTIRLQLKGVSLRSIVLFTRFPGNALGISKAVAGNTFKSPADLRGKIVGISGPGSATHNFLNLILAKEGLKPEDVSVVGVGSGPTAIAAIRRKGELYAISNLDPAMTELERSGDIFIVADSRTEAGTRTIYGGAYASGSVYATQAFVEKNPNTAQAVVNAVVRTLEWIKTATVPQIIAALPPEIYSANAELYRLSLERNITGYSPNGLLSEEAASNVAKAISRFDTSLDMTKVDLAKTYDNSFVERALKSAP